MSQASVVSGPAAVDSDLAPIGVSEAVARRRSIRRFRPDAIPDEILYRLLNAMRRAPSGANRQAWKFVVVRDEATRVKVAEACTYITRSGAERRQMWIAKAPAVIVACGFDRQAAARWYRGGRAVITRGDNPLEELRAAKIEHETCLDFDLAIALEHLALVAVEEGLGTCWVGGLDEPKLKAALSIPEDWRAPLAMPVGYPDEWPTPRARKPLAEIVCFDRFD